MKFFILFLLISSSVFSQDKDQWNQYKVDKFSILSIDDNQGKWLSDNLPKIKTWCYERMGHKDKEFSKECRIFCVPNKIKLNELFLINNSKVRFDNNLNVMWLVLDEQPINCVAPYLTMVCIKETDNKFPWWFYVGCSQLSIDAKHINMNLKDFKIHIDSDKEVVTSKNLLNLNQDQYYALSNADRAIFDTESMLLTLMLKQELGKYKLNYYLSLNSKYESIYCLKNTYGFDSYESFDKKYIKYCFDISKQIDKIPESYFNIGR